MSVEKIEKDTYVVRFEHEIIVKSGDPLVVAQAAQILQESVVLNPELKRTITKLDAPADTRMRIRMRGDVPMFYRVPLLLPSLEAIAALDAEPGENAKVSGQSGEGYLYRPDVKPGADGLDLRYTLTSKGPKGGVWIEVDYLRHASMAAAEQQARQQQQAQQAQQQAPARAPLKGLPGGRR